LGKRRDDAGLILNGSYDYRVHDAAQQERSVARYYFNLIGPEGAFPDAQGVEVPEADWEPVVVRTINEIRAEEPELFDLGVGWSIEVVDQDGRRVGTIPL
jgi:hypothetical protein